MLPLSAPLPSSVGGTNISAPPTPNAIPGQAGAVAPGSLPTSNTTQTNAAPPPTGNSSQPDTDAQGNNTETPTRGEYAKTSRPDVSEEELQESQELSRRDRQVRSHEAAHAAAGGRYTRGTSFTYRRGPDGRLYAVGGEVKIDTAPVPNNPEATLQKAEAIRAAALAPAQPSSQDRQVALNAARMAANARAEIQHQQRAESADEADAERPMHSRIAAYFNTQPQEPAPGSQFTAAV